MDELTNYHRWRNNIYKKALTKVPERKKKFLTTSGIEIPEMLTAPQNPNYAANLGYPGEYPFTRGVQPTMYRGKLWTMRQYSGFSTAEESNKRFRYLLEAGQTGLSVAFDLPTQIGYDADDEMALGEVGKVGVSISSLSDMEILLAQIPLDKVSTSMTINAPAGVLLAMYIAVAQKRGIELGKLRGTIQNDILKEYIARGTYIYPPTQSMRLITDIIQYASQEVPHWNPISISGYHIREAGATAAQEIAFTLANAIAYVEAALRAGSEIDDFAGKLSFFFNAHNQVFEEVAKFRAARRLWARIMKDRFGAKNQTSMQMRFHTQTAGSTLTAQQPENNIARVTLQALSAILGGTQSLHTNSMDEALWLPTEKAVQIALRTQQIIAHESGVADSIDPLAGSYLVEYLTDELEVKALDYLKEIDRLGGALNAIENGYIQLEIQNAAYQTQLEIENCDSVIVGLNKFQTTEKLTLEKLNFDQSIENQARQRLKTLRAERDNHRVVELRNQLFNASKTSQNLMPLFIECVSNNVTLGEICGTLREVWGLYTSTEI